MANNSSSGGLAPMSLDSDNLGNYLSSIQNLTGTQGSNLVDQGGATAAAGQKQFGAGYGALSGMLQYFQSLAKGSSDKLEGTLPEVQSVLSQYDSARKAMGETQPRGGMRASQGANLKFKEMGDIGGLVQKARQGGAQGATGIASEMAGLGLEESGIGLKQQSLGEKGLADTMQGLLSRKQINGPSFGQTLGQSFAGSLGSGLAGLASFLI